MNRERRVFKLAFPLKYQFNMKDLELVIIDRFSEHRTIKLENLQEINEKSFDKDNFVLLEVTYAKSKQVLLAPQIVAGINGYTLFHSSVPKSKGHGVAKSVYEYYKRDRDLSYYTLIKKEGAKPKKVPLGSLRDVKSRIGQTVWIIHHNFRSEENFDRKKLADHLSPNLANRQVMKGILDILVEEGLLVQVKPSTEEKKRGRASEKFRKTKMLEMFIIDPRSFLKPNGVNVG